MIANQRKVSFCKQWALLYKRFMVFTVRNPISIVFLVFMAMFQSFIQASLFWKLGQDKFTLTDMNRNTEIIGNLVGLSFLVAQDQFMNGCFGQVMAIPQYNPIF